MQHFINSTMTPHEEALANAEYIKLESDAYAQTMEAKRLRNRIIKYITNVFKRA